MRAGRRILAGLLFAALLAPAAVAAAGKPRDKMLSGRFPDVTAEEKALTKVPFAENAPAVVLVQTRQDEWGQHGVLFVQRVRFFRRVKILGLPAGERYASYQQTLYGDYAMESMDARVVLPDGTTISAKDNIHRDRSRSGYQVIAVAFPNVQVGAILDFEASLYTEEVGRLFPDPFFLQQDLPVLESRYVYVPPVGLTWRAALRDIPVGLSEPERVVLQPRVSYAYVWTFPNAAPLPAEPHRPPADDVSQALFIVPQFYAGGGEHFDLAKDWLSYSKFKDDILTLWIKRKSRAAQDLAEQATAGKTSVRDKAEAIRAVLRQKVRVERLSTGCEHESADDVLAAGRGTSADVARTFVAMLRAVGVKAAPAAIRRRSGGVLPTICPVPALFDDVLVRIEEETGPVFWSPGSDLPIGQLPADCRGVLAAVLDGKTQAPVMTPDFRVGENRLVRSTVGQIDAANAAAAETTTTYTGSFAERWRDRLRDRNEAERKEFVRDYLRRWIPGAEVVALTVENLDDPAKDLKLKIQWKAEDLFTRAGNRLVLRPTLFTPVQASDWAAATRKYDVVFEEPSDQTDSVSWTLPAGTTGVVAPPAVHQEVAGVGLFDGSAEGWSNKVVARRHFRLDAAGFAAAAWPTLQKFFQPAAAFDEGALVATFAE